MARLLTVIPARAGSKGVPGKNLRPLDGIPLIAHALRMARRCAIEMRIVVSTDSDEIARIAVEEGGEVPFIRPPELATDDVPVTPVIEHAMRFLDDRGWRADAVLSLQPTAPLLTSESLDAALRRIVEDDAISSIVSATLIRHFHPFRAYRLDDGDILEPLTEYTTERFQQKQDRPPAYGLTGGFILRRRYLLEGGHPGFALGKRCAAQIVSEEEAVDIDSEVDFLLAEAILRHRAARLAAVAL